MKTLILISTLALFASAEPRTYLLKDKTVIRAEILAVEGEDVRLRFHVEGGGGIVTRKLEDFTPASQFNIKRAVTDKDDLEGHLALAEFAVQNGLIAAGRREIFAAREIAQDHGIAPELEDRIMDEAVRIIDGLLREMIAEGKTKDAKHLLREMMQAPRLSDEQKQELVDLVHAGTTTTATAKPEEPSNTAKTPTTESRELSTAENRQLKPLQERLEKGRSHEKKALMNSRSQSSAISEYNRAIKEFEIIDKNTSSILKRPSSSSGLVIALQSLGKEAEDAMISSLLGQASIYFTRSSFNDALDNIGQVLAIDPQNQQALDMRARIEIAANDDDDYWRGGVRRIRRGDARRRTGPSGRRGGGRR
ncbi:MAG: hypothetical protein ACYTG5_10545 [Planctomycetota bacterium]|jgi:hypothetical protein